MRTLIVLFALIAICGASLGAGEDGAAKPQLGLYQRDGVLYKDGQPYRGVGANYFDLFNRVLHDPNNTTSLDGLKRLGEAGVPFVRFAIGFDARDWRVYYENRDAFLKSMDRVVESAERANVGLIPSFFWCFMQWPDLSNEPRDQWGNPESQTHAKMREFAGTIIERYKNSRALWAYEFGNEANLAADLPNAANFRKKGGTERDDLTAKIMGVMLSEFAKEVRRHDACRLIISGNSHPRASAWHNTAEKSWKPDTRDQTIEVLRRDNPAPLDTLTVHLYADAPMQKDVAAWAADYAEYLRVWVGLARELKRPTFVGEFGIGAKEANDVARPKFEKMLADMEAAKVDLAAFWVFDLKNQEKTWNVSFENDRAYMLTLTAEANKRWNAAAKTAADEHFSVGIPGSAPKK